MKDTKEEKRKKKTIKIDEKKKNQKKIKKTKVFNHKRNADNRTRTY